MIRVLLKHFLSPGDVLMLTGAVRDLHRAYPGKYDVQVQTSAIQLWDNNPLVKPCFLPQQYSPADGQYTIVHCHYPALGQSNARPIHFVGAFHEFLGEALGVRIPVTEFRGDVYLSEAETATCPFEDGTHQLLEDVGKYWIIVAGGKTDFTTKWYPKYLYQQVVNRLHGGIHFVQCGEVTHFHPKLKGVTDLIGRTDLRQFLRLVYHSEGVLCPVTFAMHAAAAVPSKKPAFTIPVEPGLGTQCQIAPPLRPCVVVAGGREAPHWEAYPGHRFLHTVGALDCCAHGGCYRNRCNKMLDGSEKDSKHLCLKPVEWSDGYSYPKCMTMISPEQICRAIESYYEGGVLQY